MLKPIPESSRCLRASAKPAAWLLLTMPSRNGTSGTGRRLFIFVVPLSFSFWMRAARCSAMSPIVNFVSMSNVFRPKLPNGA